VHLRRNYVLGVRLRPADYDLLKRWAQSQALTLASAVRREAVRAARRSAASSERPESHRESDAAR